MSKPDDGLFTPPLTAPRKCHHRIRIFSWQLDSMPEYTDSLPTSTTPFKMWKCARFTAEGQLWFVGQFYPVDDPDQMGVRWFEVTYLAGPPPPGWQAPDWSNYQRWEKMKESKSRTLYATNVGRDRFVEIQHHKREIDG